MLPRHYINGSRLYLAAWTCIALIASAGAVHDFRHDDTTGNNTAELAFAITTVSISTIMLLAVVVESVHNYNARKTAAAKQDKSRTVQTWDEFLNWMHRHNMPNRVLHIFIQLLSISSVAISAIYLHQETYNWHFGLCVALMIMVLLYNVLYLPCHILDVALFTALPPMQKQMVMSNYEQTAFVWKASQANAHLELLDDK